MCTLACGLRLECIELVILIIPFSLSKICAYHELFTCLISEIVIVWLSN